MAKGEGFYKCPEGHYVRIEGEDVHPHHDVIIDLFCEAHDAWMQPVPGPDAPPLGSGGE